MLWITGGLLVLSFCLIVLWPLAVAAPYIPVTLPDNRRVRFAAAGVAALAAITLLAGAALIFSGEPVQVAASSL